MNTFLPTLQQRMAGPRPMAPMRMLPMILHRCPAYSQLCGIRARRLSHHMYALTSGHWNLQLRSWRNLWKPKQCLQVRNTSQSQMRIAGHHPSAHAPSYPHRHCRRWDHPALMPPHANHFHPPKYSQASLPLDPSKQGGNLLSCLRKMNAHRRCLSLSPWPWRRLWTVFTLVAGHTSCVRGSALSSCSCLHHVACSHLRRPLSHNAFSPPQTLLSLNLSLSRCLPPRLSGLRVSV